MAEEREREQRDQEAVKPSEAETRPQEEAEAAEAKPEQAAEAPEVKPEAGEAAEERRQEEAGEAPAAQDGQPEPDGAAVAGEEHPAAAEEAEPAIDQAEPDQPVAEEAPGEREAPSPVELTADARYSATGKRKSSIARVVLRPGSGALEMNGRSLETYFPRRTLQETVRQPLRVTGYLERVDVSAKVHGGGVSSQADAVRHGIAKALIEAQPSLRAELKRRQLLTRDPRVKERRKAGLKKARKRPQFSKR